MAAAGPIFFFCDFFFTQGGARMTARQGGSLQQKKIKGGKAPLRGEEGRGEGRARGGRGICGMSRARFNLTLATGRKRAGGGGGRSPQH